MEVQHPYAGPYDGGVSRWKTGARGIFGVSSRRAETGQVDGMGLAITDAQQAQPLGPGRTEAGEDVSYGTQALEEGWIQMGAGPSQASSRGLSP